MNTTTFTLSLFFRTVMFPQSEKAERLCFVCVVFWPIFQLKRITIGQKSESKKLFITTI